MPTRLQTPETGVKHLVIGETCGCADHEHDLVHELSKRLDALWRYDQYIVNAEGHAAVQQFWQEMKSQETTNIKRLKELN
jgi:hypothetical protein